MLEDMVQIVPQEVCLKCDGCCRFQLPDSDWRPKLMPWDMDKIKEQSDTHNYVFTARTETIEHQWPCTFFIPETNRCAVYEQRPFECRLYPFLLRKEDGKLIVSVHLSCPHIQDLLGTEEFDQQVEVLKDFFKEKKGQLMAADVFDRVPSYEKYKAELKDLFEIE